ncbi:MAG: hypothetical protein ACLTXI_04585 [Collinsella sp.]
MIEAGLAFIATDKQVYLPFLGVALNGGKSHAGDRKQVSVETLSPQAQRLAIMALYGELDGAKRHSGGECSRCRKDDRLARVRRTRCRRPLDRHVRRAPTGPTPRPE